jgi:hypothetical protein
MEVACLITYSSPLFTPYVRCKGSRAEGIVLWARDVM